MIGYENLLIIAAAILFYVLLPLLRMLFRQLYWRGVRRAILRASRYDQVGYRFLEGQSDPRGRFYGRFDGIENSRCFWLEEGAFSLRVSGRMRGCFLLPSRAGRGGDSLARSYRPVTMQALRLNQIQYLTASLSNPRVMVSGKLSNDNGIRQIDPELVVFYEGRDEHVIERALDSSSTRYSIISFSNLFIYSAGSLLFFLISYFIAQINPFVTRVSQLVSFSFALMPFFFFLPPAVFFLYLFRRNDKTLRRLLYKRYLLKIKGSDQISSIDIEKKRLKTFVFSLCYLVLTYASAFAAAFFMILLLS